MLTTEKETTQITGIEKCLCSNKNNRRIVEYLLETCGGAFLGKPLKKWSHQMTHIQKLSLICNQW